MELLDKVESCIWKWSWFMKSIICSMQMLLSEIPSETRKVTSMYEMDEGKTIERIALAD